MAKYRWWEVAAALTVVAIGAGAYVIAKAARRRQAVPERPVDGAGATPNRPANAPGASGAPRRAANAPPKPKLACAAVNVFIRKDPTSGKFLVMQECLSHVLSLAKTFDLYVIAQCESDEEEAQITAALDEAGAFARGLDRLKLLFCDTPVGLGHMARHIEPYLYIDTNPASVVTLHRFVNSTVLVTENGLRPQDVPPQVFVVKSVREVNV